jgi:sulfur relay (sulfurtransferase) DsrC/TusE family protein
LTIALTENIVNLSTHKKTCKSQLKTTTKNIYYLEMSDNKKHTSSWIIEGADFEPNDEVYKITRFHKVWFELLKIHPHIRNLHEIGINQAMKDSNFSNELIKVYEDFRMDEIFTDQLLFKDWWWKYGQELFNTYTNKQGLHFFAAIQEGESNEYAMRLCNQGIKDYLHIQRSQNKMEGFLAVTVSLSGDKRQMLKQFDNLLESILNDIEKYPTPKATQPKYKISHGVQIKKVNRLLSLLHRAIDLHDVKEQWKIGFDVGVYKSGTQGYNYKTLPSDNKTTLIQDTCRELKYAKNLLENAANGKFPCIDNVESNALDYKEMFGFRKAMITRERNLVKQREKAAYRLQSEQNKEKIELQRLRYEALNKI